MTTGKRYWFAATPFGYGWWRPGSGFGWAAVAAAIALVLLAGYRFPPGDLPLPFWSSIVAVVVVFLAICKLKGEPLGRRNT